MDEHRPQATGTTEKAAKAAGTAAANAKAAFELSNVNAPEPPRASRDVIDGAKDAAGEALASIAKNAGDHAAATAETLRQQTLRAGDSLSRRAGANPLTALLIAGAVGYGLAYLLHRRRTLPQPRTAGAENT